MVPGRPAEAGGTRMNEYMKALQAILLGAKVLGITEAPWLWIFLPTVYAISIGVAEGIAIALKEVLK